MLTLMATLGLTILTVSRPDGSNHTFNPGPYSGRENCEAQKAALVDADWDSLLDRFPDLFATPAEVSSFVRRAFTCERVPLDGKWLLIDRRLELLNSEWFQNRAR